MIVVTGGVGFIGYNLVLKLIELGYEDIVIVDNNLKRMMSIERELHEHRNILYLTVEDSYLWLGFNKHDIDVVFHLGARTDTSEKDEKIFEHLNYNYSKFIWNLCRETNTPLIYASSAATYGDGEDGFDDEENLLDLKPLNPYGCSKHDFDLYAVGESFAGLFNGMEWGAPKHWYGLKFFNVYGNHEQHKGAMASVMLHFYNQIKETGEVKLFRSHVDFCEDGEQKRDFIHVDDVVNTLIWMYNFRKDVPSDIYNLGTGTARTYNDLAKAIFKSLGKEPKISYIDTPLEIRDSYQYYTRAKMDKLCQHMLWDSFKTLEEGIDLYIKQLENENC